MMTDSLHLLGHALHRHIQTLEFLLGVAFALLARVFDGFEITTVRGGFLFILEQRWKRRLAPRIQLLKRLLPRVFDVVHGFQILGCRFVFPSRAFRRVLTLLCRAHTLLILFARRLERLAIILLYVLFKLFILALLHLVRVLHLTLVVLGLGQFASRRWFLWKRCAKRRGRGRGIVVAGNLVRRVAVVHQSIVSLREAAHDLRDGFAHGVENAGTFAQALVRDVVGSARLRFQFIGGRR